MGQLKFKSHTLDDELVRDGLCAVGALEDNPLSRGQSYVVGGVATQSYLPSSCRRPTSDIDLAVLRPLTFEDFRDFSRTAVQCLTDNKYSAETKKGHTSYQIIFFTGEEVGVIEFARRSRQNLEERRDILMREKANVRKKILEERDVTYEVCSPEDIVVPKMLRDVRALMRNHEFCEYIQSGKPVPLTEEGVKKALEKIQEYRDEAVLHAGNPELSERLRFISDIFDIRILSEIVGFNDKYLKEAIGSWNGLRDRTPARDLLFNYLLPKMNFGKIY